MGYEALHGTCIVAPARRRALFLGSPQGQRTDRCLASASACTSRRARTASRITTFRPLPSLCAGINPDTACRPPGLRFASSRSAPPPTVPLEVQFSPGIPMGAAMEANLLQQLKADKCIMAAEEALNGSVSDSGVEGGGGGGFPGGSLLLRFEKELGGCKETREGSRQGKGRAGQLPGTHGIVSQEVGAAV